VPNADDGLPQSGPALQQAFEALVTILNERQIRYAIIGGLAVLQHTRARTTDDDARRGLCENCVIEASRLQG